jgi:hypothetical protein
MVPLDPPVPLELPDLLALVGQGEGQLAPLVLKVQLVLREHKVQ